MTVGWERCLVFYEDAKSDKRPVAPCRIVPDKRLAQQQAAIHQGHSSDILTAAMQAGKCITAVSTQCQPPCCLLNFACSRHQHVVSACTTILWRYSSGHACFHNPQLHAADTHHVSHHSSRNRRVLIAQCAFGTIRGHHLCLTPPHPLKPSTLSVW